MTKKEFKSLIVESVNELSTESSLDNIITWASNAKRHINNRQNPQIFYKLVKAIQDASLELMNKETTLEGYGYGDLSDDPKQAFKGAKWTIDYRSQKEMDKKDE